MRSDPTYCPNWPKLMNGEAKNHYRDPKEVEHTRISQHDKYAHSSCLPDPNLLYLDICHLIIEVDSLASIVHDSS